MHPALRTWRDDASSILLQLLAYGSGLGAAAVFAVYVAGTPKATAPGATATQPEWIEVDRPHPAFALTIPEAGDASASYAILRHGTGGGRKDVLSLGDRTGTTPSLRIEIYRAGRETGRFGDAAGTIAAFADNPGSAIVSAGDLDSKFGPFATASFVTKDDPPQKCVGFVRAYNEPLLQIAGVFCQAETFVERSMLTCALDRLTLVASGNDLKIAALFAQAELRRDFCGQRSTLLAPTPKYRTLWKALEQRRPAGDR